MQTMMHAKADRPLKVAAIYPDNSQSVTLRDPDGNSIVLFTHDADSCRMVAAAFPLTGDCQLILDDEPITDPKRILAWIKGEYRVGQVVPIVNSGFAPHA